MVFDEDQRPVRENFGETNRVNDERRTYRESENASARERPDRRQHAPRRQAHTPTDPFFDQPYEPNTPADTQPAWEAAAKTNPAHSGISANIKPKKKVAALFKAAA